MPVHEPSTSVSLPEEAKPHNFISSSPQLPHSDALLLEMEARNDSGSTQEPVKITSSEAQDGPHFRSDYDGTEPPPSAQQPKHAETSDVSDQGKEEEHEEHSVEGEEEYDPGERIPDFPWTEMLIRYHDAMDQATRDEIQLLDEWVQLMQVLIILGIFFPLKGVK